MRPTHAPLPSLPDLLAMVLRPCVQSGCPKPKEVATKAELDQQAACMQREAREVDNSDLGLLMRRHLREPTAPLPAGERCAPFRQVDSSQLSSRVHACLALVGEARWTSQGVVDAPNSTLPPSEGGVPASVCGRRWLGTTDSRCLLRGKDLLFIGNSVVRRQMYTLLDLLAGPRAHRQLTNFTDVLLPHPDTRAVDRSWVWDQDNMTRGYHASQLFTVDLETGEHRFEMAHATRCGLGQSHSVFNPGRLHQWREPGVGGGSEELTGSWRQSKWAGREWRPLISLRLQLPDNDRSRSRATGESCAPRTLSWAGSAPGSVEYIQPPREAIRGAAVAVAADSRNDGRRRRRGLAAGGNLGTRLRARLLRDVESFFLTARASGLENGAGPDVREWLHNVSVHYEESEGRVSARGRRARSGGGQGPNVWLYFPTYHGERERFNGFCEDKSCECTNVLASCHRHPECRNRHVCKPLPARSAVFVEYARTFGRCARLPSSLRPLQSHVNAPPAPLPKMAVAFAPCLASEQPSAVPALGACARAHMAASDAPRANGKHLCPRRGAAGAFMAALVSKGRLLGYPISAVRLTPFYDDCWPNRGRCQGMRPCREPVDHAWTCRATAMLCVGRTWADALAEAKAWVPKGHPSMSMLYMYDGQTSELLDETFRTWGVQSVGYGADAVIFGPQFGSFHGATAWRVTLGAMRSALRASDACLGRRTLTIFRSPAFNFDPVNTPRQQAAFGRYMRPLVEEAGMLYIDNYPSTYDAVFQKTPHAIKFAKNSAFHYLNAGRYLMAQLVLHSMRLLS